jgi:hypothetical protein
MPAQKIARLLATSSELQSLYGQARRLHELQRVYVESAPRPLAQASRVKNYRAGTLYLLAGNAAVAAKLRQLVPRLLAKIQKQEPEITGIRVDVQVAEASRGRPDSACNRSLSTEIIENFRRLSEQVKEPALKAALVRLVDRHTRANQPSGDQHQALKHVQRHENHQENDG